MEHSDSSLPSNVEYIINNRNNWSLAADVELLKYLHSVSTKVLNGAQTTLFELDSFENELNDAYTEVNNINSKLLALSDSQFLENRVKEDEKIKRTSENIETEKIKVDEKDTTAKLKQALDNGIQLLNTQYNVIQVTGSDSDSETESETGEVLLKARNLYQSRKLPYLIGSEYFMNDDRVGLGNSSAEETDNEDDENESSIDDKESSEYVNTTLRKESLRDGISISVSECDSENSASYSGEYANQYTKENNNENQNNAAASHTQAEISFADQLKERISNFSSPLSPPTSVYNPTMMPHMGDVFSPPPLNNKGSNTESDSYKSDDSEEDLFAGTNDSVGQKFPKSPIESFWNANKLFQNAENVAGRIYDDRPPELNPAEAVVSSNKNSADVKSIDESNEKTFLSLASGSTASGNDQNNSKETGNVRKMINEENTPKLSYMNELLSKLNKSNDKQSADKNEDNAKQLNNQYADLFKDAPPPIHQTAQNNTMLGNEDEPFGNNDSDEDSFKSFSTTAVKNEKTNSSADDKQQKNSENSNSSKHSNEQSEQLKSTGKKKSVLFDDYNLKDDDDDLFSSVIIGKKSKNNSATVENDFSSTASKAGTLFDNNKEHLFSVINRIHSMRNENDYPSFEPPPMSKTNDNENTSQYDAATDESSLVSEAKDNEKPGRAKSTNLFDDDDTNFSFINTPSRNLKPSPIVAKPTTIARSDVNNGKPSPADEKILQPTEVDGNCSSSNKASQKTVDDGAIKKKIDEPTISTGMKEALSPTLIDYGYGRTINQGEFSSIIPDKPLNGNAPVNSDNMKNERKQEKTTEALVIDFERPPTDDLFSSLTSKSDDKKADSAFNKSESAADKPEKSPQKNIPRKLNPNLGFNINVNALLPNAKRISGMKKEIAEVVSNEGEGAVVDENNGKVSSDITEQDKVFNVNSDILPSCTKDRVKIRTKRRPPTRRPYSSIETKDNNNVKTFSADDIDHGTKNSESLFCKISDDTDAIKRRPFSYNEDNFKSFKILNDPPAINELPESLSTGDRESASLPIVATETHTTALLHDSSSSNRSELISASDSIKITSEDKIFRSSSKSNVVSTISTAAPDKIKNNDTVDEVPRNVPSTTPLSKDYETKVNPTIVQKQNNMEKINKEVVGKADAKCEKKSTDIFNSSKSSSKSFKFQSLFDVNDEDDDLDDLFKNILSQKKPAASNQRVTEANSNSNTNIDSYGTIGSRLQSESDATSSGKNRLATKYDISETTESAVIDSNDKTYLDERSIIEEHSLKKEGNITFSKEPESCDNNVNFLDDIFAGLSSTSLSLDDTNKKLRDLFSNRPPITMESNKDTAAESFNKSSSSLIAEDTTPAVSSSTGRSFNSKVNEKDNSLTNDNVKTSRFDQKDKHLFSKNTEASSDEENLFRTSSKISSDLPSDQSTKTSNSSEQPHVAHVSDMFSDNVKAVEVSRDNRSNNSVKSDARNDDANSTGKKSISQKNISKGGGNIFGDDEDDDDDIFGSVKRKPKLLQSTLPKTKQEKKSIFDDEENDEFNDLFNKKSSKSNPDAHKDSSLQKQVASKGRIVKLQSKTVDNNPLF